MKEILKNYTLVKWASAGLSYEDVKYYIRNNGLAKYKEDAEKYLCKESEDNSFFLSTLPALAFGVPLIGGAAYYMISNPDIQKKRLREERQRDIQRAIFRESSK